jgi:3-hydroxyisobutyrate dehydrogenase-like beta-hydroxyacid dehydrogenase
MTVSVIGLGKIGSAIIPHLLKLGENVKVWNRSQPAIDQMVSLGAKSTSNLADAMSADIVFSALFDDAAVREIMTSELLAGATAGRMLHVCLSTISPDLADDLCRLHAAQNLGYLSAPLFGRPEAVRQKAAQVCVAGKTELIDRALPYIQSFGHVWRIGEEPRQANVAKLCGNFLIGAAVGAMAEVSGILSAESADTDAFMTLMTESLFSSPIYRNYALSVSGAHPLPASGLALPRKDMELLASVAAAQGSSAGLLETLRNSLAQADMAGLGDEDWSVALGTLARRFNAHS